jgi:hypothetical protein
VEWPVLEVSENASIDISDALEVACVNVPSGPKYLASRRGNHMIQKITGISRTMDIDRME